MKVQKTTVQTPDGPGTIALAVPTEFPDEHVLRLALLSLLKIPPDVTSSDYLLVVGEDGWAPVLHPDPADLIGHDSLGIQVGDLALGIQASGRPDTLYQRVDGVVRVFWRDQKNPVARALLFG
jgi:hypothetical protein